MAWDAGCLQMGHSDSVFSQMRLAHSKQKRLWPQGTRAATTALSKHTIQSLLGFLLGASDSMGLLVELVVHLVEAAGKPPATREPEVVLLTMLFTSGENDKVEVVQTAPPPMRSPTSGTVKGSLRIRLAGG